MREIIFHCWSGIFPFFSPTSIYQVRHTHQIFNRFAPEQISRKMGKRAFNAYVNASDRKLFRQTPNHCRITLKPRLPGRSVVAEWRKLYCAEISGGWIFLSGKARRFTFDSEKRQFPYFGRLLFKITRARATDQKFRKQICFFDRSPRFTCSSMNQK